MAFLDNLIQMLSSIESDKIAVHDERCVVMRNRNARCLRCAAACTSGALLLEGGQLSVFPDKCIGCGTCAAACPTSAIEVQTPTDEELTRALKRSLVVTGGRPIVACERAVDAARARLDDDAKMAGWRGTLGIAPKDARVLDEDALVEVPCLGRVDESLIAAMAAYGADEGALVCHGCETCDRTTGGLQAFDVMESAERLLGAFGRDFTIHFEETVPQRAIVAPDQTFRARHKEDFSAAKAARDASAAAEGADAQAANPERRAMLGQAAGAATALAGDAVLDALGLAEGEAPEPIAPRYRKVGAGGNLSRFVPTRRTRLYNYLRHLGEPVAADVKNRVIGHVDIDTSACTSCRMCSVFCPTGALDKAEDGDFWGLVHRPAACVQCRSCESLCPKGAITVSDTVPMAQFMGREAVLYSMERPKWEANKPDSLYRKIHQVIGEDLEMCSF